MFYSASLPLRYVAFVSEETSAYLTVESPPHYRALQLHATSHTLSLNNLFAMLPGGRMLALATNSLLNLCDPLLANEPGGTGNYVGPTAPGTTNHPHLAPHYGASIISGTLPATRSNMPTVCSGRRTRKGDPHYHLLRSLVGLTNTSQFEIKYLGLQQGE